MTSQHARRISEAHIPHPTVRIHATPDLEAAEHATLTHLVHMLAQRHPDSSFRVNFPFHPPNTAVAIALVSPHDSFHVHGLYTSAYCDTRFAALVNLTHRVRDMQRAATPLPFADGGHAVFVENSGSASHHDVASIGIKGTSGAIMADVERFYVAGRAREPVLSRTAQILLRSLLFAAHIAFPEVRTTEFDIHVQRFHDVEGGHVLPLFRASVMVRRPLSSDDEGDLASSLPLDDCLAVGPVERDVHASLKRLRHDLLLTPAKHVMKAPWKGGRQEKRTWPGERRAAPHVQIPRGSG